MGSGSSYFGYNAASSTGQLSDTTPVYGGATYIIQTVLDQNDGRLRFSVDVPIPDEFKSALILHVGNRKFALADATRSTASLTNDTLYWSNAGLSWSAGDEVQLRLTLAVELSTLTASVSPDPIVEGSDLWSPTLTVKDLGTTAPAPANVGCDDSQAGVQCSSALSDNVFTFKGVAYTVKAISYNQRKVAADINTFTVKTYEESLKLTLDKSIPESLRSCLTLHSGNARIPLAGDSLVGAGVDAELSDSNGVANSTVTVTEISGEAWGLNWSAGDSVKLRLPNVGCLTLTLSEPVTEVTSMQWRRGGTTDSSDYQHITLPTFAANSTTASTPIKPVDDSEAEGCETIVLNMTMWPGTDKSVHEYYRVSIKDDDGGTACPPESEELRRTPGGM